MYTMTESLNMDSNDIVGSLDGFESLDTIEAELDILNDATNENVRIIRAEDMEIMHSISVKEMNVKEEIIMDQEDTVDDEDMGEDLNAHLGDRIIEDNVHEMIQEVDVHEVEMDEGQDQSESKELNVDQLGEEEDIDPLCDQHRLFSEGIIGDEEIIDDSQIITEEAVEVHHILTSDQIHSEQILDDNVKYLEDIMNDNVNETIIEAAEVEDRTLDIDIPFEVDCSTDMKTSLLPIIISAAPINEAPPTSESEIINSNRTPVSVQSEKLPVILKNIDAVSHFVESPVNSSSRLGISVGSNKTTLDSVPPLASVLKAQTQETVKPITTGVYVVNSSGSATPIQQTLIQSGGTLIAPKDAKISRFMTVPNIENPGQTIRIVAPPGKFNSTAKAITLAQARQMGLISPTGRINSILPSTAKSLPTTPMSLSKLVVPSSKKSVTVVKSPTKILPAPPATSHKLQKILIRQANSVKTSALVASGSTTAPTSAHMIRIPANQTIQQILPGTSKQVQYVKLVSAGGAPKGQTLVPVSLSKTIPVLTTNILNSPTTTFKMVPISAQARSTPVAGQRVLIPASAVPTSSQNPISPSQIVMLPSHVIQQVKKGDCKLVPAVSSANVPSLRATNVNGSRKAATVTPAPLLKIKEPIPISASSTPVNVVSSTIPVTTIAASPPTPPPPLLPTPVTTPPTPPSQQTSPQSPLTGDVSPTGVASATNINALQQSKVVDVKQEQWSGDESTYLEANGIRPRKPCNCTKSMCLKLYCDCFANGEFCYQCNCTCCYNNLKHEEERQRAIKSCLERNPDAFKPKIGKTLAGSEERRHNRGCNCKRSGCLKNYCECFEAKIPCSKNCKCASCKNTDNYLGKRGSGDEERSKYKLDSRYDQHPGHLYSSACRQAFSMMSPEVIQATCQCLIAQAEKWDKSDRVGNAEETQKLIIEEFGHCLVQIIDCVTKSIPQQAPVSSTT